MVQSVRGKGEHSVVLKRCEIANIVAHGQGKLIWLNPCKYRIVTKIKDATKHSLIGRQEVRKKNLHQIFFIIWNHGK